MINMKLKNMMSMLPQWMEMATNEESNGARFLNIFGIEMDQIEREIDNMLNNSTVQSYDVNNVDITYKIPMALPVIVDIIDREQMSFFYEENEYFLRESITIENFYKTNDEDEAPGAAGKFIVDREDGVIYVRLNSVFLEKNIEKPIESFFINGIEHFDYVLHHVWNGLDEIGLLFGIERNFGERNQKFKERIIESIQKPANASDFGLKNLLSRELDISISEIEINEMSDNTFRENMLNLDGSPSEEFIDIVESVNDKFEKTWGSANWDSTLWSSTRAKDKGFNQLPHYWGGKLTELVGKEHIQSGIGDGDDLLVHKPKKEPRDRRFNTHVGLTGILPTDEVEDTQVEFSYKITATGKVLNEDYLPELFKYRIQAAEIIMVAFALRGYDVYEGKTSIDFKNDRNGYSLHGIQIVDGLDNLSRKDKDYIYYQIIAELETLNPSNTPEIKEFHVKWRDTYDNEYLYKFSSQEEFTENSSKVRTEFIDTYSPKHGGVELGFGTFYHQIDSHGSFLRGEITQNASINRNGSISLKLPEN